MNTVRNGTTPGSVTPLSSPEMCAHGAGMSTQSSARRSCTSAMSAALYASVACVCSTPFGAPLEPDVNSTAASCSRSVQQLGDGLAVGQRVEIVDDELRARPRARARSTSCAPSWWCSGAATAPSRQHAR